MSPPQDPSDVAKRRQVLRIIAPHVASMPQWQDRASFLSAQLSNPKSAHSERLDALIEARDLLQKVKRQRQRLVDDTKGFEGTTDQAVAVRAFDSLVERLSALK